MQLKRKDEIEANTFIFQNKTYNSQVDNMGIWLGGSV
jgi:hypothetical protein